MKNAPTAAGSAAPVTPPAKRGAPRATRVSPEDNGTVVVRPVRRTDLDEIIEIDATVTGLEKRKYWGSVYKRYGSGERREQQFLVAQAGDRVVGFVIGEVRDWEFGSPPCGWVFAIDVSPQARQGGIGTQLLHAISSNFRRVGVRKLRTMLAMDNTLILSFFRSQGMMAGPMIALEMELED